MTSRGSHRSCRTETTIYNDRKHIYDKSKVLTGKVLGSLAEFCAAFYHVPSQCGKRYSCLDESRCKIGERMDSSTSRNNAHPRTVVAIIKCEDKDGSITYEARYTNCYDDKMHAEDYFRLDVEKGALSELIMANKVSKITMFITFQPCHMAVRGTQGAREDHTCSETLLTLFRDRQFSGVRNDIEVCIKPTHLYKLTQNGPLEPEELKNAAEGIKMLINDGIEVASMDQSDWIYLSAMVESEIIIAYQGSPREALDNEISEILHDLEIETALEYPLTHKCDTDAGIYKDPKHIYKRQNDNEDIHILGSVSQLCAAFYHIYEGQMADPFRRFCCLDNGGCFTSKKKQRLQSSHDPPKTMVIVVKCEGKKGIPVYDARYTDCYGLGLFAEEFFVRDASRGELRDLINRGCITKITLFVAWPPRHNPKLDTRDNCMNLAQLHLVLLLPRRIEFHVKLAHMYKEGRPQYQDSTQVGIKILLGRGIIVTRMNLDDWKYLINNTALFSSCSDMFPSGWDWTSRRMLDEAIDAFLFPIKQEIEREKMMICQLYRPLTQIKFVSARK